MRKYPMLCPSCKHGYLKWENNAFSNGKGAWVCEECGFGLAEDNPSERGSKRSEIWDRAWDAIMS